MHSSFEVSLFGIAEQGGVGVEFGGGQRKGKRDLDT